MPVSDGKMFYRVTSQSGNTLQFDSFEDAVLFVERYSNMDFIYTIETVQIRLRTLRTRHFKSGKVYRKEETGA